MPLNIIIANNTDSPYSILLKIGGEVIQDHSVVSRAVLLSAGGEQLADSDEYPAAWDFSATDKITLVLGKGGLPNGAGFTAKLITYTSQYPNGFLWDDDINLSVLK